MKSLLNVVRYIIADFFLQISFILILLLLVFVWTYTSSVFLTIAAGVIAILLSYFLTFKIKGDSKKKQK